MKAKVAAIIVAGIVAVVSLGVADSSSLPPEPAGDLATISRQLHQTRLQLAQVDARVSALEEHTRALQRSNAELQREVRRLQERKSQVPRWYYPVTNGVPPLTPLKSN